MSKSSRDLNPDAIEARAKKLLEKAAKLKNQKLMNIGKLVMQHHKNRFADFDLDRFKKQINDMLQ